MIKKPFHAWRAWCTAIRFGAIVAAVGGCAGLPPDPPGGPPRPGLTAPDRSLLPTGQWLTPTAAPGAHFEDLNPGLAAFPDFRAGHAVSSALSPDRRTLLVLTSGYNNNLDAAGQLVASASHEYVFVFDVSGGRPVQKQVLQVPNTYLGLSFTPDGRQFLVSGGGDDNVHRFRLQEGQWVESGTPIALGHTGTNSLRARPLAAGLAVTADGRWAVVANRYNDSISVLDLARRRVIAELDLRPGKSGGVSEVAGGEDPHSVCIVGNTTAFVSSERDREVVVVDLAGPVPRVEQRIAVAGNPNKMLLNRAQTRLYVAADNSDAVHVIDTRERRLLASLPTVAPPGLLKGVRYRGASPNALALSHDEKTLYVTNRGTNAVAVLALDQPGSPVTGLIPTGWYPSDVAVSGDGRTLWVINSKSLTGPNPGNCLRDGGGPCQVAGTPVKLAQNQNILQLQRAGLLTLPTPSGDTLATLTRQVAANNHFNYQPGEADRALLAALRQRIRHVIYVIKENRTYDQVLGDLGRGRGDPKLTEFPGPVTPNHHRLAEQFVTLDDFRIAGEVSGSGWPYLLAGRESDYGAKMLPVHHARRPDGKRGRGGSYDWEGLVRGINTGITGYVRLLASPATPRDPEILPGHGSTAAPDGPGGEVQQGYLWNAALRAGLTVRNYGMFVDVMAYTPIVGRHQIPLDRDPQATGRVVAYPAHPDLGGRTDPFFRGYDNAFPDFYRVREWEREFREFAANGQLPALSLVRLPGNHTGDFERALDGVNTPELQVADNDYAVGRLVEAVANSRHARDTLIVVVEDAAQGGPDHRDAYRGVVLFAGPYLKRSALISTPYTSLNLLRTITDLLGLDHLSLFDAAAAPMADIFDLNQAGWRFKAQASPLLKATTLPIPPADFAPPR